MNSILTYYIDTHLLVNYLIFTCKRNQIQSTNHLNYFERQYYVLNHDTFTVHHYTQTNT